MAEQKNFFYTKNSQNNLDKNTGNYYTESVIIPNK